jgi:O-antigen ligase
MILYYIFVLTLPFVAHPWFGIGIGGITVEKVVGAAAIVYAVVHLAFREKKPVFVDTWPARAFLVFFLLALGSHWLFGINGPTEQAFTFHPFNFLLMFFMTVSVVDSIPRLRRTLLAAVASLAWASLYMLRDYQGGSATYGAGYRPGYVVGDPNYFASSALLCLPLAYLFSRSVPQRWLRWSCAASVVLILAAMTVSGSRGGFLGLAAVVLILIWHSKRRLLALILVAFVGVAFLAISPISPVNRLLHPSASDDGGKAVRLVMWSAAWRMFCDNPILGVGYGNFRVVAPRYVSQDVGHDFLAHNEYLELLATMGLPGPLALIGMFVASFVTLHRVLRTAKRCGSRFLVDAALGIQTGLIGYAISIFFLSAGFLRLSWFMVFISACMPSLAADAAATKRARDRRNRSNTALESEAPIVALPGQDEEHRELWR